MAARYRAAQAGVKRRPQLHVADMPAIPGVEAHAEESTPRGPHCMVRERPS